MRLPSDQPSKLVTADFYKRVDSKLSDLDVRGAVRLLSTEESFAKFSVTTFNTLQEKHPTPPTTVPTHQSPKPSDDALQVTQVQVRKSVMSFASGSAAGSDGFRPQYLKDLLSISAGNVSTDVISALTDLMNFMLRGEVNPTVSKYLYGASLCDMVSKLNVWYQDDGTLSDSPDIVLKDFAHLIQLSKEIGLEINPSKCELHFSSGQIDIEVVRKFNILAPGIRVVNDEDFNLLGAPILVPGLEKMASSVFDKVFLMFDRLQNLKAHSAFYLLKNCFAVPKFNYLIRTSPYWSHRGILKQFNDKLKDTLEGILNLKLENKN